MFVGVLASFDCSVGFGWLRCLEVFGLLFRGFDLTSGLGIVVVGWFCICCLVGICLEVICFGVDFCSTLLSCVFVIMNLGS